VPTSPCASIHFKAAACFPALSTCSGQLLAQKDYVMETIFLPHDHQQVFDDEDCMETSPQLCSKFNLVDFAQTNDQNIWREGTTALCNNYRSKTNGSIKR